MPRNRMLYAVPLILALLCVAGGNLFYKLGSASIVSFDEARHGVSAFEMLESRNYLVNTYDGAVDYMNLKPPLAFATMAAGFSLFGHTVFALRVFSAVAALLAVLAVMAACKKDGGWAASFLAAGILLTSRTFIAHHNARSGDADALFILLYAAAVCLVLARSASPGRYAAACFLASLAFLTKSFHAGPLCLTLAVFFFMDHTVSAKTLLAGFGSFLCFLFPVLFWAWLRHRHDGMAFFNAMVALDAVARMTGPLDGHAGGITYTLDFILSDFKTWMLFCIPVCAAAFLPPRAIPQTPPPGGRVFAKLCIATLIPVAVFTLSSTKLRWYAFSAYPFIAMLMAHFLAYCLRRKRHSPLAAALICVLVAGAFAVSEYRTASAITGRIKRFDDPLQQEMAAVSRSHAGRVHLFLLSGGWEQSHVLAAKFAGNLVLERGGPEEYSRFAGEKALLAKAYVRQ